MVSSSLCQRLLFACVHRLSEEAFPFVSLCLHSCCCFTDVRCFSNLLQFFFFSLCHSWTSASSSPSSRGHPRQFCLLTLHTFCTSFLSLSIFSLLFHTTAVLFPCSVFLSLSDCCGLFICLLFLSSSETFGAKFSLTLFGLFSFLNQSQLFLVGCLILSKASKRGKKRGWTYSKSVLLFFFF